LVGTLFLPFEDRAGGTFHFRSTVRAEIRAPAAGFVREVCLDEGDRASPGAVVLRLEVPDLAARVAQKQAEVRQSGARVHIPADGVCEHRRRVTRCERWHDRAKADLERAERALAEELARLEKLIDHAQAEVDAARGALERARAAEARGVAAGEQIQE